ncbi:hypothetical protein [Pontibacter chitinilyticus]|uniref:hypothetical protein n=1 Tax=Pontibacter chitinilyticus TaxID=2674989 RepID=UPI003219DE85
MKHLNPLLLLVLFLLLSCSEHVEDVAPATVAADTFQEEARQYFENEVLAQQKEPNKHSQANTQNNNPRRNLIKVPTGLGLIPSHGLQVRR